jgi:hypothetical protein
MPITFYPYEEDLGSRPLATKLEILMLAAERYKAIVQETNIKVTESSTSPTKLMSPRELAHAYNWQELAKVLRELREAPEQNQANRLTKAEHLMKLAEIYEVLRGAKMPKLEAVRLALVNEANQLKTTNG